MVQKLVNNQCTITFSLLKNKKDLIFIIFVQWKVTEMCLYKVLPFKEKYIKIKIYVNQLKSQIIAK